MLSSVLDFNLVSHQRPHKSMESPMWKAQGKSLEEGALERSMDLCGQWRYKPCTSITVKHLAHTGLGSATLCATRNRKFFQSLQPFSNYGVFRATSFSYRADVSICLKILLCSSACWCPSFPPRILLTSEVRCPRASGNKSTYSMLTCGFGESHIIARGCRIREGLPSW